jgi:hypothetical protein
MTRLGDRLPFGRNYGLTTLNVQPATVGVGGQLIVWIDRGIVPTQNTNFLGHLRLAILDCISAKVF